MVAAVRPRQRTFAVSAGVYGGSPGRAGADRRLQLTATIASAEFLCDSPAARRPSQPLTSPHIRRYGNSSDDVGTMDRML